MRVYNLRITRREDWFAADQILWQEASRVGNEQGLSSSNTFIKAAYHNLNHLGHNEYKTIGDRHDFYDLMSYVIEFDRNTSSKIKKIKFFHAAFVVTGSPGVRTAETPLGQMILEDKTRKIMIEVNKLLFEANMKVLRKLLLIWKTPKSPFDNSPVSVFEFDTLMVVFEQTLVEKYLASNKNLLTSEVRKDLKESLDPDSFGQSLNPSMTPLKWATNFRKRKLDFLNMVDRVAIGIAFIHLFHKRKESDFSSFMAIYLSKLAN